MEFGLDTIIVAIIGACATIYGIREARAGRRDATIQQAAANKLADDKQELESLRTIIENVRTEADRARNDRLEARQEADEERARRLKLETDLREEVRRERTARIEAETSMRMSEEHLRRATRRHAEEYEALLVLVRDEVAREAGRTELLLEQAEGES